MSPTPPPAFGRNFPMSSEPEVSPSTAEVMGLPSYDTGPPAPRPEARTKLFAGAPPPPSGHPVPPPIPAGANLPNLPPPPNFSKSVHSVSIVMPAPDGSMMAPLSRGPADYVIVRRGKRHGPYDIGQLERLIPMGKLRSIDAVEVQSTGQQILAVDLPGLRPLFEERARVEEASVVRTMPTPPPSMASPSPTDDTRNRLWAVIGVLALALVAAALFMAFK